MKVAETYERSLKKNEIVITVDEYGMNESYQERMLLENDVTGLLSLKIEYKNDKKEYRYEISNKINLEEIGKQEKISYAFLKRFLNQIAEIFKALDRFMLEEDKLLFEPMYIYFDKDSLKLHMLFFPERNTEESDFTKLTEYLIRSIDQEDELAVWSAYVLERDAKMENFSFLSFLNSMHVHEQECATKNKEICEYDLKEEKILPVFQEDNTKIKLPISRYIRLGIAFGLSAIYFVAGNLITGRYAFEYYKSMILLGIIMAITMGAILWTVFDMVKAKNEDRWEEKKEE